MHPDRSERIEQIIRAASALPEELRRTYLSEACSGDEELRKSVEAMLNDHTKTVAFSPLPEDGQQVGPYRLGAKLGEGGMGEVFSAIDVRLNRRVAVKVCREKFTGRFQREAQALSSLNHPHICTLYDVGPNYLVMELVEGTTLAAHIAKGPLPLEEVIRYGIQIADAIADAHKLGIVHRDLKPGNIMVTRHGVKVLDFGLAKMVSQEAMTETNVILGTPSYMAPEQFQGLEADARADLFSLGLVLYQMAAGTLPFPGASLGRVLLETSSCEIKPLSAMRKEGPPELDTIIAKLLQRDPKDRPASAVEVATDLRALGGAGSPSQTNLSLKQPPPSKVSAHRSIWKWAGLGTVAATVIAAGLWFEQRPPQAEAPQTQTIAVLPLRNLSGDSSQQYFADGLTEQLITDLSKVRALRVVAMPSVMRYAGQETDLNRVAKDLGVQLLLTGSLLKAGDRVRINIQLVQMPENRNVWAENYDHRLEDVLGLQAQVASAVATSVRVTLTPEEQTKLAAAKPVDKETNELYLQARFLANKGTEEGLRKGIEYFERAVARDPKFANGFSGLASAYSQMGYVFVAPGDAMPQAKVAARKAVDLDATLAEPHVVLGMIALYTDWDWDVAEKELQVALSLNPSSALAHILYEDMLLTTGRIEEALVEGQKSIELDPLSVRALSEAQFANIIAGRYGKTIELGQKIAEIEPQSSMGHIYTGLAYAEMHDLTKANAELETAVRLEPTVLAKGFLAHVRALAGDRDGAHKMLEEIKALNAKRYVCAFEVATVYATLGEKDEAFRWMNEGLKKRADCMVWLKSEPWLKSIRDDPRFDQLVKGVGLR